MTKAPPKYLVKVNLNTSTSWKQHKWGPKNSREQQGGDLEMWGLGICRRGLTPTPTHSPQIIKNSVHRQSIWEQGWAEDGKQSLINSYLIVGFHGIYYYICVCVCNSVQVFEEKLQVRPHGQFQVTFLGRVPEVDCPNSTNSDPNNLWPLVFTGNKGFVFFSTYF